jgi:predicted SAM-dependent methyltransferase
VLFVFREFYRMMKPGTYARIIVPDLEIYVEKHNLFSFAETSLLDLDETEYAASDGASS